MVMTTSARQLVKARAKHRLYLFLLLSCSLIALEQLRACSAATTQSFPHVTLLLPKLVPHYLFVNSV
jgi:hypothetical protein